MVSLLSLSIDEMFPKADESLRREIESKVITYLLEIVKKEAFLGADNEYKLFEEELLKISDMNERSKMFFEKLSERTKNLPQLEQERISKLVDGRLAELMHKLYLAYQE